VRRGHISDQPEARLAGTRWGASESGKLLDMTYDASSDRYAGKMPYRRSGRSGLKLPAISLGLWHNFGSETPLATQRSIVLRAFDLGVTHFDLANNYGDQARLSSSSLFASYGPPYGAAEANFGTIVRSDLRRYRDELIISTKAGYDMWPGPYGEWGSRKYLLSSLDQSLSRMGLDYVDIFYSHRFDPDTPLEETVGALDTAVRSGRALYAGISSYTAEQTAEAAAILRQMGTPLLIHQPSYSLLNRWIEGVLAASPGPAEHEVPGRHPGRIAGQPGRFALGRSDQREESGPRPGAEPDRQRTRPVPSTASAVLGSARPAGHLRADRRQQRRATRGESCRRWADGVQCRGTGGHRQAGR